LWRVWPRTENAKRARFLWRRASHRPDSPRPSVRYSMHLPSTLNDRLRTSPRCRVHALDSFSRRLNDKDGRSKTAPLGISIACPTAAMERACVASTTKRGTVPSNPFAGMPLPSAVSKRDRVLTDEEAAFRLMAARPARSLATGPQRLGALLEVTEAMLNHLSGSRAGRRRDLSGA